MNHKKLISSLLIAAQLAFYVPAYADPVPQPSITLPTPPPPVAGEPDVGAAVSPLKKGQTAPFTGVLLSPKAVATVIAQLNSMQEQINIEIAHAKAEAGAQCEFKTTELTTKCVADKKILSAQVDEQNKRINILNDQLKKNGDRPNVTLWTGLGAGAGFVLGIGLSMLTVYAIGQSAK